MKLKKVRSMLLAIALSCAMAVAPVMAAPDTGTTAASASAAAAELENQKAATQNEMDALQEQLNTLMTKMNDLEIQLIEKGQQITQAEADLADAQAREQQQYEDLKLRIKYMYEEGDGSAVERIFESGSIAEALTQAEYVQKVHTYDREQLEAYQETVQQVSDLKTSLEDDMVKLESLEGEYQAQSSELSGTIESKRSEVSNLDAMIQEAARVAVERAAAEKAAAEKAAAEKAAAEKAAAEQAAAQQAAAQQAADQQAAAQQTANQQAAAQQTETTDQAAPQASAGQISPAPQETTGITDNSAPVQDTPVVEQDTGYIEDTSAAESAPAEPSYTAATGNAIVDRAYSWLGAEYVWGACSPGAFDCSGFVSYCLTGAYSRLGTTYTFMGYPQVSDPQPGDICVNYDHCGIYIGGGQMIHAATEGVGVIVGPVQSGMIYVRY